VDGRDLRLLEHVERGGDPASLQDTHVGVGLGALEALAQAQFHGGGRVLGEGDGRDLLERRHAPAQQRFDAVDEQGGLAGARAGRQHQARGVIVARARGPPRPPGG